MAENVFTGYRRLFEIHVLHHYWLDDGATVYDLTNSPESQARHLLDYDCRAFVALAPTPNTAKALKGFRCVYKGTSVGGVVAVPQAAVLPIDITLQFIITVQSAAFFNYTALTLPSKTIYTLYDAAQKKTRRYKENVPVLSNLTGATRGAAANKRLFLSKELRVRGANDKVESLVVENSALLQLTSDQPGAGARIINPTAANLPVFVNQDDVPTLVPPPGLSGVPQRGIELSQDISGDVFAVVRLSARRLDDDDFSYLDANGKAKSSAPIYQIRFKNRSTLWKYFDKRTQTLKSSEPEPLPLTYFGNAGTKQKASPDGVKAVKSGVHIDQLTSEIFI